MSFAPATCLAKSSFNTDCAQARKAAQQPLLPLWKLLPGPFHTTPPAESSISNCSRRSIFCTHGEFQSAASDLAQNHNPKALANEAKAKAMRAQVRLHTQHVEGTDGAGIPPGATFCHTFSKCFLGCVAATQRRARCPWSHDYKSRVCELLAALLPRAQMFVQAVPPLISTPLTQSNQPSCKVLLFCRWGAWSTCKRSLSVDKQHFTQYMGACRQCSQALAGLFPPTLPTSETMGIAKSLCNSYSSYVTSPGKELQAPTIRR